MNLELAIPLIAYFLAAVLLFWRTPQKRKRGEAR